MEQQPKSISLKTRIIAILLAILVPLVLALNLYALYINASFSTRVAELNEVSLAGYVEQVTEILTPAQDAMREIVGNSYDFRSLRFKLDALDAYNKAYNIYLKLKGLVSAQPSIAGMVLYSGGNGQFMPAWGTVSLPAREEARSYILGWDRETWKTLAGTWKAVEFAGSYYLCLVYAHTAQTGDTGDVHLFCFIGLDQLAKSGEQAVAFTSGDAYLTSRALAEDNGLPVPAGGERVMAAGAPQRYMMLSRAVPGTAVQAVYLIPTANLYEGVGPFQLLLLLISLLAIAMVPLGYWWLKRALFRPMDGLVAAMETASTGDLTVRAPGGYRDREFRTMGSTFNSMLEQIQDLKIESYEQELAAKQAQLSFLQLQIRPHFYLNCMKNLYGMAQDRQFDEIQEMLVLLSNYLRYMMGSNTQWVTLEQELQNSCNYIRLQQFNQAYPPDYQLSVDANALDARIPPITMLTFVENSIKHAAPQSSLMITLRARRLASEDGPILLLSVQDNGSGFPPDTLERLNRLDEQPLEDSHVGINNVWQRLRLLYGQGCGLVFSNSEGALVEIFLPMGPIGENDDTADS